MMDHEEIKQIVSHLSGETTEIASGDLQLRGIFNPESKKLFLPLLT